MHLVDVIKESSHFADHEYTLEKSKHLKVEK